MGNPEQIQTVLEVVSLTALGALIVYQYLHYVVAGWRYWSDSSRRFFWTGLVAIGWAAYGICTLTVIPSSGSYIDGLPLTIAALYAPTILALIGLAFSKNFRSFADSLSIRWLVESVAGPARMIVGVIFLFWYFAGRLPAVVAWIAGPGDWISGFITYIAVRQLQPFADSADIRKRHWSANDYVKAKPTAPYQNSLKKMLGRGLTIAAIFVAFGILDFIAAPASTAISISMGNIPEEMGNIPLAIIPLLLVPQVLVLEILAMRQFYVLHRHLNKKNQESG